MRVVRVLYQLVQNPVAVLRPDHFVQVAKTLVDLESLPVRIHRVVQHIADLPVQILGGRVGHARSAVSINPPMRAAANAESPGLSAPRERGSSHRHDRTQSSFLLSRSM